MKTFTLVFLGLMMGAFVVNGKESNEPAVSSQKPSYLISEQNAAKLKDPVERKLYAAKVPEITFNQATLKDVAVRLAELTFKHDATYDGKVVNFVIGRGLNGTEPPSITFSAQNVSVLEILKFVTKDTGFHYTIQRGAVVFTKPQKVPTSISNTNTASNSGNQ